MATPSVLDFDALFAPIADDQPAGSDLREDSSPTSLYYKLKDARKGARDAERNVDPDNPPAGVLAEWRTIRDIAPKALASKTKDLEVVGWLIEALARTDGFAGLRDGFRLARELVERFWDSLYPYDEDDVVPTRVGPLAGLNGEGAEGTLLQPIRMIPITDSDVAYAYWHYQQAADIARISDPDVRERRIARGAVPMDAFEKSAAETSAAFFKELVSDLGECLEEFGKLMAALDERAGSDSPPGSAIRATLDQVMEAVRFASRGKIETGTASEAAPTVSSAASVAAGAPAAVMVAAPAVTLAGAGTIASREDAFRVLLQIADFFRRAEPHSPISYTLEELVRRGRMSLPELLSELLSDANARNAFFTTAGIKPPSSETNSGGNSGGSGW